MSHAEKGIMVTQVCNYLKDSSGVIVTNFGNLKVVEIDELRRKLEKRSTRLIVSKNTLLKKALEKVKLDQVSGMIEGMTGIAAYKDDPVAVAKVLFDFSKDHETFKVRGGVIDGEVIDEARTKVLSQLPSKDVLRAMVLMRMKSPISGLVNVISGPIRGFIVALNQISKQKNG